MVEVLVVAGAGPRACSLLSGRGFTHVGAEVDNFGLGIRRVRYAKGGGETGRSWGFNPGSGGQC